MVKDRWFFNSGLTDQGPYKDFGYGDKFLEIINICSDTATASTQSVYNESTVPLKTDWARVDYVDRGLKAWKDRYQLI